MFKNSNLIEDDARTIVTSIVRNEEIIDVLEEYIHHIALTALIEKYPRIDPLDLHILLKDTDIKRTIIEGLPGTLINCRDDDDDDIGNNGFRP